MVGSSVWTRGRTSWLWGWRSPGTGCPGRLWSLLLWRYSRPTRTRSCAAWCRQPCFRRRVGLDDPQRSLPTPTILWFCEIPFTSLLCNWLHAMFLVWLCEHVLSSLFWMSATDRSQVWNPINVQYTVVPPPKGQRTRIWQLFKKVQHRREVRR